MSAKRKLWTQSQVTQAKAQVSGRIMSLLIMPTAQLLKEYQHHFTQPAPANFTRDTLLRYLILEALDRALPDTLKDTRNANPQTFDQ